MKINVSKLEEEVRNLNQLTSEFEYNILNIYNILNNISNEWKSEKATYFFEDVYQEKQQVKQFINNITKLNDIYKLLISKYEKLGKEIDVNLEGKKIILSSFDYYVNSLEKASKRFRNLTLNEEMPEKSKLISQQQKLISLIQKSKSLKEKLYKCFNNIENIETEVAQKIRSLSIKYLNQERMKKNSLGNTSQDILFDLDGIEKDKLKLDYYKSEEMIFFDKFNNTIKNVDHVYQSKNKEAISIKIFEFKRNFQKIEEEHTKKINMIEEEIVFYKNASGKSFNQNRNSCDLIG